MAFHEGGLKVSFTDIMIWSIFVNRMDLAKVIWRHTTLPVHSALLACQLYRYLSDHCSDKEGYLENADWFENEAIKMMDILAYSDIKDVLVWQWQEMGHRTALEIAQDSQCKRFICHSHVQSLLDDSFYSDQYGKVEPTIATVRIWLSIVLPVFIYLIYKQNENAEKKSMFYFYRLPIVKFWTNTFFYCGFLFLQAWVLCSLDEGDDYLLVEYILWIWVFSLIADELQQYMKDRAGHFRYLSNFIDVLLLMLHVLYMILRWTAQEANPDHINTTRVYLASVNTLIVACIFSWGRLLNAFAINDSLGPMYFIIIRLFKDIFIWIFVFVIFAISFQLGFISITKQGQQDPLTGYPEGTFPVSFFTIVGEFGYAADILTGTPLGVALLGIYAFIAQILLVNLLIAMMGDTYSNVSDNSAEEWKFYRLELMMENQSTSFHPPPTNLIIVPVQLVLQYWEKPKQKGDPREMQPLVTGGGNNENAEEKTNLNAKPEKPASAFDLSRVLKKMRIARDEVIDAETEEEETSVQNIVTNVHERLRTLANERENDRTFLNKKFKDLETTLTAAANQAAASGGGGAVAGLALDKLHETIHFLQESNTLLTQQNQRILTVLDQINDKQTQMAQQLQGQQQQIALLQQGRTGGQGGGQGGLLVPGGDRGRAESRARGASTSRGLAVREEIVREDQGGEGSSEGGAIINDSSI